MTARQTCVALRSLSDVLNPLQSEFHIVVIWNTFKPRSRGAFFYQNQLLKVSGPDRNSNLAPQDNPDLGLTGFFCTGFDHAGLIAPQTARRPKAPIARPATGETEKKGTAIARANRPPTNALPDFFFSAPQCGQLDRPPEAGEPQIVQLITRSFRLETFSINIRPKKSDAKVGPSFIG